MRYDEGSKIKKHHRQMKLNETCKNQLKLAIHHHSDNTQTYRKLNHFRINHIAAHKKNLKQVIITK
jgi:hypothetical protein